MQPGSWAKQKATLPFYHLKDSTADYGACPVGSFCPAMASGPTLCPAGTYGSQDSLESAEQCSVCPEGYACPSKGTKSCDEKAAGGKESCVACSPGYYCRAGSTSPKPAKAEEGGLCPKGHKCIKGRKIVCLAGTFQDNTGKDKCTPCDAGFYCDRGATAQTECPKGWYCPKGSSSYTKKPCDIGTYGNKTKGVDKSACTPCDQGKFCGRLGLEKPEGDCLDGYECDHHSASPTGSGPCRVGYFCKLGVKYPCKAGFFCPDTGMKDTGTYRCWPGYNCIEGASEPNPDDKTGHPCKPGNFCPDGQSRFCPAGTFRKEPAAGRAGDCLPCRPGHFCEKEQTVDPKACVEGTFCPPRSTAPKDCTKGKERSSLLTPAWIAF